MRVGRKWRVPGVRSTGGTRSLPPCVCVPLTHTHPAGLHHALAHTHTQALPPPAGARGRGGVRAGWGCLGQTRLWRHAGWAEGGAWGAGVGLGTGGSRRRGWGWRARGTRAGNSAGGGDAACRAPLAHTHTPPSLASIPPSLCLLLLSGHQHVQQQLGGQEDQPRLVAVARHPRCCLRAHTPQPSQPASGRPGWRVLVVSGTRQCVG